jgi:hypothetical protein
VLVRRVAHPVLVDERGERFFATGTSSGRAAWGAAKGRKLIACSGCFSIVSINVPRPAERAASLRAFQSLISVSLSAGKRREPLPFWSA